MSHTSIARSLDSRSGRNAVTGRQSRDFLDCLSSNPTHEAIAQCRAAREQLGRGRFSLWTGGTGLAVYLWIA
jgi:hypothetical protein